jgi:AcrR family transcriptional regulator
MAPSSSGLEGAVSIVAARHAQKSKTLIAVASGILNRKGVRGMTLAEVAAAVGVTTPSVAYYFPKKEDLAATCMLDAVERLDASIAIAAQEKTPGARVKRLLDLHLEHLFAIAAGEAPALAAFHDIRALSKFHGEMVRDGVNAMFHRLRDLLEPPREGGRRALNARAKLLFDQLLWLVVWTPRYDADDRPRLCARMFDVLENGLAQPGAAWDPLPLEGLDPSGPPAAENSMETFLRAATRLINQQGYKGASVQKISASLNVTKGSFYHHNEAKDDLVIASFERTHEVMLRAQRAALAVAKTQYEALMSSTAALIAYQLSESGPLLRTDARTSMPEDIRLMMTAKADRISDRFAAMISDGIAEGSIRAVDAAIAAQLIHATINSVVDLPELAPHLTGEDAVELFARPMLTGCLRP